MKSISSFLSQDGIVLEELDLSRNSGILKSNNSFLSIYFTGVTDRGLKSIEGAIIGRIDTHIIIKTSTDYFEDGMRIWKTDLVPLFISRCELLCFTQDINNSQDSLFHFLGVGCECWTWKLKLLSQVFACMISQSCLCLASKFLEIEKYICYGD